MRKLLGLLVVGLTLATVPVGCGDKAKDLQERYDSGERKFVGINLRGVNLRNAYLNRANLENADLRDADLTLANLGGANLKGADLTGATLESTNLFAAYYDLKTKLPKEINPENYRMIRAE
jgi:uncharacterized protein YjbI with pentapeptide repeats